MIVLFLVAGCAGCVVYQLIRGYTTSSPACTCRISRWTRSFLLIGALALFLQVIANNKFLGYLLIVVYSAQPHRARPAPLRAQPVQLRQRAGRAVFGHERLRPFPRRAPVVSTPTGPACAIALLVLAALFWVRGTAQAWRERHAPRARAPARAVAQIALRVAAGVRRPRRLDLLQHQRAQPLPDRHRRTKQRADYEKNTAKYKDLPQPKITA